MPEAVPEAETERETEIVPEEKAEIAPETDLETKRETKPISLKKGQDFEPKSESLAASATPRKGARTCFSNCKDIKVFRKHF